MRRCVASLVLGVSLAVIVRSAPVRPAFAFQFPLPGSGLNVSALAVDPQGNSYVAASLYGGSFPVSDNAAQISSASMVIIKIDATGQRIVWATYLGGHKNRNFYWRGPMDLPTGIAVDPAGNAIVTGTTAASDFPTVNAAVTTPQPTGSEGFLTKIAADGTRLLYSTYLGSAYARAVAVDPIGNAYVGLSDAKPLDYERTDLSAVPGRGTLVAAKFNPAGRPLFATRFGPASSATIADLAVGPDASIVITGTTLSADFPLVNPAMSRCTPVASGTCSAPYVAKLRPGGTAFGYATLLTGGDPTTTPWSVAVAPDGAAYVAVTTTATDYPVVDALEPAPFAGGSYALTRLSPNGAIQASTYIAALPVGGSHPIVLVNPAGQVGFAATGASAAVSSLGLLHPDAPILISTDAGASWSRAGDGLPGSVAALASTRTGVWYAGANDGVYRSIDGGLSWTRVSSGLAGDSVAEIAVDDVHRGTMYAGARSGTYRTTDDGESWIRIDPGMFFGGIVRTGLAVDGNGWILVGTEGVRESHDAGRTWFDISNGLRVYTTGTAPHYGEVGPIVFDVNRAGTMYALQSRALYRTRDGGQSWSPIARLPAGSVDAVATVPGRPGRLFASSYYETLRSDDDGQTWTDLGLRVGAKQILIRPDQPDTVYIVSSFGESTLYVSADAGRRWTPMPSTGAGALPLTTARLAFDPRRAGRILAAASVRTLPLVVSFDAAIATIGYGAYVDQGASAYGASVAAAAQDPTGAIYIVRSGSGAPMLIKLAPPQILNPSRRGSS